MSVGPGAPPVSDLATALHTLLDATARYTGNAFFDALARTTAEVLGCPIAFVGARRGPAHVSVLSVWADGQPAPPFEYELRGTPCANVLETGTCQVPAHVRELFPDDPMLVEMGIEAYYGIPVRGASGEVLGIVVALDRTERAPIPQLDLILAAFATRTGIELERLRTEQALRANEEQLRRLIDTTLEGVWVLDEHGRTTLANPPMAQMLGYTVDEMIGMAASELMDERAREQAVALLERRRRGIAERFDFRLRHKNGSDVWVVSASSPLMIDGRFTGALAMVTDITERRNLELRVQHAQKLESLGVLAGGIAHDFNNLLVGILGNVGLAMRKLPPQSQVVPLLEDVQTAATRAADLTRQMLAYSGRGRFVIEPIALNTVVEEMIHLLRTVISKKAVLRLDLSPDIPAIDGDATQIRQVVMNLVTNASDALGDKQGVISIVTGAFHATREYLRETYLDDQLPDGYYAFLEVSDTGAGMDAATRARIFDPFFTTKFAGRGLGLAATLGILRGHKGAINVYSEPGRGSSFKVLLPCRDVGVEVAAPPPAVTVRAVASGLVLVVDDEPAIRAVAARVLAEVGYTVKLASDGREAVQVFTQHADDIACVLLDVTMPGLSGEEAFRELRRVRPDVRVVLSSGYNEQEATQRFVGKGLAGFLAKPWTADGLIAAIQQAIAGG